MFYIVFDQKSIYGNVKIVTKHVDSKEDFLFNNFTFSHVQPSYLIRLHVRNSPVPVRWADCFDFMKMHVIVNLLIRPNILTVIHTSLDHSLIIQANISVQIFFVTKLSLVRCRHKKKWWWMTWPWTLAGVGRFPVPRQTSTQR